MRANRQLHRDVALAQNFHGASLSAQHACDLELLGTDSAARREVSEVAYVDFAKFDAERIPKTPAVWQLSDEW